MARQEQAAPSSTQSMLKSRRRSTASLTRSATRRRTAGGPHGCGRRRLLGGCRAAAAPWRARRRTARGSRARRARRTCRRRAPCSTSTAIAMRGLLDRGEGTRTTRAAASACGFLSLSSRGVGRRPAPSRSCRPPRCPAAARAARCPRRTTARMPRLHGGQRAGSMPRSSGGGTGTGLPPTAFTRCGLHQLAAVGRPPRPAAPAAAA